MKKIYLVDVDCETELAQELVNEMNMRVERYFTSRNQATEYLIGAYHYLKKKFASEIKAIKKHCKQFNHDEVINLNLWQAKCNDDFDINEDSFFEQNYNQIDHRYLYGRY